VLALKAGADQTMSWPASRSVAMATVEAMLDRHQRLTCCREPVTSAIAAGHLSLDPECHVASWRGRDLKLTANEFAILRRLSHRPGTVRSREQLMGPEGAQRLPERTIDSHIKRIRKKFRAVDPAFDRIETMYGLGYRFVAEDPLDAPAPIALARSFRLGGAGKGGA
jgi:two-component system response regulator ChvI